MSSTTLSLEGLSNSSRNSSPARSHRGKGNSRNNSPHGRFDTWTLFTESSFQKFLFFLLSSRGNSRRNSPHSRPGSPPRQTRVFRRAGSPRFYLSFFCLRFFLEQNTVLAKTNYFPRSAGGRSTVSRTPSPPHSYR